MKCWILLYCDVTLEREYDYGLLLLCYGLVYVLMIRVKAIEVNLTYL